MNLVIYNKFFSFRFLNFLIQSIALLAALFMCVVAYAAEDEKVILVFDNREWELGWSKSKDVNDKSVFDKYILKGENVNNWSELVTIQFFPGLNKDITLDVYEAVNKQGIMSVCPNTVWDSYEQQKDERSWYFTIKNCQGRPDQSELVRCIKTGKGIHVFHYAIKKSPMPKKLKQIWSNNLKAIKISTSEAH
jgi:hypothetical protein